MLTVHTCRSPGALDAAVSGDHPRHGCVWLDVLRPTAEDAETVLRTTGLTLPTLAELSEVESSSRLRSEGEAIYLSLPVCYRTPAGDARTTPLGLIITAERLVTIRFEELKAFDAFRQRIDKGELGHPSTVGIFVALLEAIVDRLADILEEAGGDLDQVAEGVFGRDKDPARAPAGSKVQDAQLRGTLKRIGRDGQLIAKVRSTLLGVGRIVPYVQGEARHWFPPEALPRLDTLRQDVASLDEYETHLSDKVQFLLDAALGLISIEQNDTFRVLTIVSVVGIPPTLVASMYGMNFKNMPELNWAYGYAWGLGLIALSAIIPLIYFRVKGWL
jgi:magnesium transporter